MMHSVRIGVVVTFGVLFFNVSGVDALSKKQTKAQTINRLFIMGFKQSSNKQWKGCITTYQKLAALYPTPSVYRSLAGCHKALGNYKTARSFYQRALRTKVKPYDPKTQKGAASIRKVKMLIADIDKRIEAKERLKTAVAIAQKARSKGDYGTAIKHFLEAYEFDKNGLYLLEAAFSAQKSKRYTYALSLTEQALAETIKPLSDAQRKRARGLKNQL